MPLAGSPTTSPPQPTSNSTTSCPSQGRSLHLLQTCSLLVDTPPRPPLPGRDAVRGHEPPLPAPPHRKHCPLAGPPTLGWAGRELPQARCVRVGRSSGQGGLNQP